MTTQTIPALTEAFNDCGWVNVNDPTKEVWLLMPPDAPVIIGVTDEFGAWSILSRGEAISGHESREATMSAAEQYAARPDIAKAHADTYAARQRAKRLAELAA